MTTETRSLHRKLAEVMAEVERIPKRGVAPPEMGGFSFVQVGDAADPIRKALSERHVTMLPTEVEIVGQVEHEGKNRKGEPVTTTTVDLRTTWTFTDGESGESITIQSVGTGADRGDKYTPKAMTASMKYALLLAFLMPTGDDPELSNSEERGTRRTRAPVAVEGLHDPETGGLIGMAEARGNDDFELRPEKTRGYVLPFRLTEGRDSVKVVAFGRLAEAIERVKPDVLGKRVTIWGSFSPRSFDKMVDGKKKTIAYQVFELTKLQSPDWTIPADEAVDAPPADDRNADDVPPDDLDLAGIDDAMVAAGR